jgi:hypothetical protein
MIMDGQQIRIWKKAVVAYSVYYSGIRLERLSKKKKDVK